MNTLSKQFCEYTELFYIKEGESASLYAINHPIEGSGIVHTSAVQSYDPVSGRIETRNTIYVKT